MAGSWAKAVSDLERAEHDNGTKKVKPFGYDESTGESIQQAIGDILAHYKFANLDVSGDPLYLGFLQITGQWYIQKISISGGTVEYVKGSSDYATNWTGRAGLSYGAFDTIW
jgi:hypothetical protein